MVSVSSVGVIERLTGWESAPVLPSAVTARDRVPEECCSVKQAAPDGELGGLEPGGEGDARRQAQGESPRREGDRIVVRAEGGALDGDRDELRPGGAGAGKGQRQHENEREQTAH
jgi:hypothetical protein